jgi:predicted metal-dependent phosphoesterase TrpH
MLADLHTHTYFSDGTFSPDALVDLACQKEVAALAVTDHDTVDGCEYAALRSREKGINFVPGVELSIEYDLPGSGHLHLLGLFIDYKSPELVQTLTKLKEARKLRALKILSRLNSLGMRITTDELATAVKEGSPGRPHIVELMLQKGYIPNAMEGYTRYLAKGKPAYVPKEKLKLQAAIQLIHKAGGLAILAHPVSLRYASYARMGEEILKFKAMGLDGVEVFYPSHDYYFTKWLLDFVHKYFLAISGGSDFHGLAKPDIELGTGRGNLKVAYSVYENLTKVLNSKK